MGFTLTDNFDVQGRAQKLGLGVPSGLAFLPRNIETAGSYADLVHESSVQTVRSLFRQNRIEETVLDRPGHKVPTIQENDFSLLLPTLFVGFLVYTGNPHAVSLALNMIGNYATDFFKGIAGKKKVVFDLVLENKGGKGCKKIHYEGEPEGLKEISKIAKEAFRDDKRD